MYKSEFVVALFKNESASNCVLRVGCNSNESRTDSITQSHPFMFKQLITCCFIVQSGLQITCLLFSHLAFVCDLSLINSIKAQLFFSGAFESRVFHHLFI